METVNFKACMNDKCKDYREGDRRTKWINTYKFCPTCGCKLVAKKHTYLVPFFQVK